MESQQPAPDKAFVLVYNGVKLTNNNRYTVDQYGNRFMVFKDSGGNTVKFYRDDLVIDHATGDCKLKDDKRKPVSH